MLVASVVFIILGLAWIMSYWNGSAGFVASYPASNMKLSLNVAVTGWPALGGLTFTVIGAVLLLVCAGLAIREVISMHRA
jgi:hypothetical protein